jgi:uncharacterized protein
MTQLLSPRRLATVLLAIGLAPGPALAAEPAGFPKPSPSFGCDSAHTRTERLVCSNVATADLDFQLGQDYLATMAHAADPARLQRDQKAWLAQRNRCTDTACLDKAYTERIAALKQVPRAEWKTYRNESLGIAFEYLSSRRVVRCAADQTQGERACLRLVGWNMGLSDYLMGFDIQRGALEPVAKEGAGFMEDPNKPGQWITTFGPGQATVERFAGPGWQGMQATVACGIMDKETGFHAAAGSCYWAVLSNGARAVVIDTEGLLGTDDDTMRSVRTFRFLK